MNRALLAVPASHVTGLLAIALARASVGGTLVVQRDFKATAYVCSTEIVH